MLIAGAEAHGALQAETYPSRPIKVIVPFGAGGGSDTFVRIIQKAIEDNQLLPQPLVVINVPGAGGTIGSQRATNAAPDGYTILNLHQGILTAKYSGKVDHGPEAFEPIIATSEDAMILAVAAALAFFSGSTAHANLIAYWDFDSASGSTVTDVSGNTITGTMSGGAALTAGGGGYTGLAGDEAINLTGNSSAQDRMTVSAVQLTPYNPGTNDFSVSFWVVALATPKSMILGDGLPSTSETSTLLGFRSRCKTAFWCAC